MATKKFDVMKISLDHDGRVVMSDEVLDMIVGSHDMVSSGANFDMCNGTTNISCINAQSCGNTWNLSCSNHEGCTGTLNGSCPPATTEPGPGVP
jgi:hypothetical protein